MCMRFWQGWFVHPRMMEEQHLWFGRHSCCPGRDQTNCRPIELIRRLAEMIRDTDYRTKTFSCCRCAEVPNLPMTVLGHQMSHVKRRPHANDRPERDPPKDQPETRPGDQD
jgi:hypothetical protein